jgi:hypothetical protein
MPVPDGEALIFMGFYNSFRGGKRFFVPLQNAFFELF